MISLLSKLQKISKNQKNGMTIPSTFIFWWVNKSFQPCSRAAIVEPGETARISRPPREPGNPAPWSMDIVWSQWVPTGQLGNRQSPFLDVPWISYNVLHIIENFVGSPQRESIHGYMVSKSWDLGKGHFLIRRQNEMQHPVAEAKHSGRSRTLGSPAADPFFQGRL